ncbi:MAG: T9SS type A sorting domain-containing protein [Candidatus Eisenbacteria bacterium]|nr:T9SS type A sorting domain-containing protein [Candidatus Latescibacterota bacterium]MBD3302798.1 T9SS type A sorting domain-containing protein [Candidatus Eisenbacteria bacterium]
MGRGNEQSGIDPSRSSPLQRVTPKGESDVRHTYRRGRGIAALAIVVLLVGFAAPVGAFQPANQNEIYEIPLPAFDLEGVRSAARTAGELQAAGTLSERYGGNWRVHSWDSQTETPRWIYGTSVKMADAITGPADLERLARQVIIENQDLLRADASALRLTDTPHALGKWVAHFQQTYHGIDVWGAKVRILFSEDGKLMLMGSDAHPDIDVSPIPALSAEQATAIARDAVPFDPATDSIEEEKTLLVLPVPLSETEVDYHLVWRVRVHTEDPLGIWVTHVDAHDGRIVWRYNDVHFAYSGTTDTEVQIYSYCDGITPMTIPYLDIDVSGIGTTTSDENGDWSIDGTGGDRTVSADLEGPWVDVYNYGGGQAAFSGTAQEDVPLTVTFDDLNAQHDERDVFDAVNDIRDFFLLFDPDFGYTNQQITANVSRPSTCNAYWNGTINFYREGGGCANTGEMQQVVHHEFGHGIQNHILGQQGGQGLGEGNSDIIGNLITQDHIIGRGFYLDNCTSGIRNSVNNLVYPDDVVGQQIHYAGQVIAGFNWDAMVLLQDEYGGGSWDAPGTIMSAERWHYGRVLGHPTTQPDQVLWTFIADDDNGNLDDGTPHHEIFCEAATNHGFECPEVLVGVFFAHADHPYTGNAVEGYEIVATTYSLPDGAGDIVPGSVTINYRVNGGEFAEVPMTATGEPDEYMGIIPAQSYDSVVEYYLYAEDTNGNSGTSPRSAPEELHYFQVNDEFPDEMESPTAWYAGAADDNASTGWWERVDPIGTEYNGNTVQPEDDHTPLGTDCWITQNGSVGGGAGDADVDNGKTTLFSPEFDLTGATDVQVRYWKYYTNNLGNNPGEDYWDVDVTNDGGDTWVPVEHTLDSPNAWVEVSFALADYVADPGVVQFRFVASDVSPGALVEAGVDDFLLAATFDVSDAEELDVRFVTDLGQNRPNPFNPVTAIRFQIAQEGPIDLAVYDATGRRVATLADGVTAAGEHTVQWNGTDDEGRPVATGTYFYKLNTNGETYSARMVLLK